MTIRGCSTTGVLALSLALAACGSEQAPRAVPAAGHKEAATMRARGTFEVKLTPQAPSGNAQDSTLGRMTMDKQFRGDLERTAQGQMLTAMSPVQGSAGYVAIERMTGKLQGRSGSFVLQHSGTMAGGSQQLAISVVPDSGTGELVGLTGQMVIIIADGKHSYEFEYSLPAPS